MVRETGLRGRAAQVVGPGQVVVDQHPVPELEAGQVLLRTTGAAICGSDLHRIFADGDAYERPAPPGHPGHEGIGRVIESRSSAFRTGQLVLAVPDHRCAGTFSDYQVVPDQFLLPVPDGSDPMRMLMAQQLGTVVYALKRFWPAGTEGETATVVGAGSAGLHFIHLLKRAGVPRVIACDLVAGRLAVARQLGADVTVHAPAESVIDATMTLTGGKGADLVVEAAGTDVARVTAMRCVRVEGRVGLFGLPERSNDLRVPYLELFRRKPTIEISIGTQHEPGLASFREALRLIGENAVNVTRHLTHTFGIEDAPLALEIARARSEGAVKVGLTFA